jgi:two-component system, OmpR family, sensor histidine kinase TctE
MAEEIKTQVGDVSTLLDDFLTYEFDHSLQVEDVVLALGEVLASLDLADFRLDFDPALMVRGDPVRIRQIIRNLVRNAQRHGGTQHSLTSRVTGEVVSIEVADNGLGVSIEVLERLFQPFAHGSTAGSLGLGLAVSHRLAKAMDGDLTYRRQDELTIFELELRAGPGL